MSGGSAEKLRFYEIDGLRFIAALIVVLYHYTFRGYAADGMSVIPFESLSIASRYGYLGVDLFFIISGFVILLSAQHGASSRFVISRMVRIYPAFWMGVCVTSLVMAVYDMPPFEFSLSTSLLNLPLIGSYVGVPYVDGVYWSLLVELKFYFLVFLVLVLGQIERIEHLLVGWLLVSLVMTVWNLPILGFFLFPEWSHYFIAGAMFYVTRVKGVSFARCAVILCCWGLSVYCATGAVPAMESHFRSEFSDVVIATIVSVFYLVFVLIALGKTRWINLPMLLPIGVLTYPLYLVHQNIGFIILNSFEGWLNKYVLLLLTIALMLTLSWIIHKTAEDRFGPVFRDLLQRTWGYSWSWYDARFGRK